MTDMDRESSTPLYQQLADKLKEQIRIGILKEKDQLMTETEMSEKFELSRVTVRKALDLLVEEDILEKRQGIGTFVTGKKLDRSLNMPMGFTQNCEITGKKASSTLLSAGLVEASPRDVKLMKLNEEDKVICIRRLRFADDVSVLIEETHFRKSFAYLLGEDLTSSLHEKLAEKGVNIIRGTKNIGICYSTKEEADLLKVEENQALLLIRDISYDENGDVVYTGKSIVNPDHYSITLSLS